MKCSPRIGGTNRATIELKMKERTLAVPRKRPPFARRGRWRRDDAGISKETGSSDEG